MTFALNPLGEISRLKDDYASAKEFYTESTQIIRQMGYRGRLAMSLLNLGQIALHEEDYVRARELFLESLAIYRQLERNHGFIGVLFGFAGVVGIMGKYKQSARIFGAAQESYQTIGRKLEPPDAIEYNRIISIVRDKLDETTFNAAWAEGQKMTLEEAIEYALEEIK